MSKFTRIAALLMAFVLCLSFAACGGKDEPETTEPVIEVTDDVNATTVADETTAADVEETSEAATDETTAEAETEATTAAEGEVTTVEGETTTEAASKKPETTEEIVAYFNTAVNGVKKGAKSIKQNHVTNYLAASPTVPSVLATVYKMLGGDEWLDGMLVDNSQGAATYTGADIKAKFPVENQSWASKLTVNDVKSATCTEANGVYTVTVVTKADGKSSTIDYGQGHTPKALNAVPPRIINDNIPGIATSITGTAAMNYPYGKVVITVDAATGRVKTAEYDVQWTINFDKAGAIIPLGTRSSYVVSW